MQLFKKKNSISSFVQQLMSQYIISLLIRNNCLYDVRIQR